MGIFRFEDLDDGKSGQFSLASPSTSLTKKKKKIKEKHDETEPVYMPRSKYYNDDENDTDDETFLQESETSICGCQKFKQKKQQSSSTHRRRKDDNENNENDIGKEKSKQKKRHHSSIGNSTSTTASTPKSVTKDDRQFLSDENDIEYYIGPKTASKTAKNLKPSEFRIYYQIPEKSPKISYKLPLFLAYMSSQNKKVFHFPIVCGKNTRSGENMWSLRYADSATFPSLLALIKYHKTYAYMDPKTGKIDTFPVWKDVIIDEDSFCET